MRRSKSSIPRSSASRAARLRKVAAAALAMFALPGVALAETRTWTDGNDIWDDNGNWFTPPDIHLQPFPSDDAVIPSGTPLCDSFEVFLNLSVAAGAGINVQGSLNSTGGMVDNDGVILIDEGAASGVAGVSVGVGVLEGDGEVVLGDSDFTVGGATLSTSGPAEGSVMHVAGHTIRGEGTVIGKWINNSLIRAEDVSGDLAGTLRIGDTMVNNGVIRSSPTAIVELQAALTMGAAGQFIADAQPIRFSGQPSFTGGSMNAMNGAKFVHGGGHVTLADTAINGDFEAVLPNPGGTITIGGAGVTNNGVMTIDGMATAEMRLVMGPGTVLGGAGTVVLNREGDTATIRGGSFTQAATHTIRGVGGIRATTVATTMINNGSIIAEPRNGTVLRVSGANIMNNNLMQANDGAVLRFQTDTFALGSVVQGAMGKIRAASGGTVEITTNMPITGGSLETDGTGLFKASGAVLTSVTNKGAFQILDDTTTRIGGGSLTNDGMITVNPGGTAGGPFAALSFDVDGTLQGTGTVVLNSTDASVTSGTGNKVITQAAGHSIRGKGLLRFASFVNHGRIEGLSAAEPLKIQATVSGDGVLKDVHFNAGAHIVGGIGTTAITPLEGSYRIDSTGFISVGRVLLDLAGITPGAGYDQLNSTGDLNIVSSFGTRLEVSLAGGFKPLPGQSFTLITTTGTLTGGFGVVTLPALAPGLSWVQTPTATSLSISVAGSLAADFDDDGDVDGADLAIWRAGFGTGTTHMQGNADGDGDVDGADFLVWQRSAGWGVTAASGAVAAAPEPGAGCLMMLATMTTSLTLGFRRRRSFNRRGFFNKLEATISPT